MGKSIRSKRMKKLRTLKREKLMPREEILLEQKAAILSMIRGEHVDESSIPQLPEIERAPKRFTHTRDGKPAPILTLKDKYGHLANNNTCITKYNTIDALRERYGKGDSQVKKEEEEEVTATTSKKDKRSLPSTLVRRAQSRRGRDRSEKPLTASANNTPVKQEQTDEDDMDMEQDNNTTTTSTKKNKQIKAVPIELDDAAPQPFNDKHSAEYGFAAHSRRGRSRSARAQSQAKSKSKKSTIIKNWSRIY